MITVNIFDLEFDHSVKEDGFYTSSQGVKPKLITYTKNNFTWDGITLFTERMLNLVDKVKSKYKVAWLLESPGVFPWSIDLVKNLESKFDVIITHNPELLSRSKKYIRFSVGSLRVENPRIAEKTKLCSIIASAKDYLPGHKLRHKIIQSFPNRFDVWGSKYKSFTSKEQPLADYMFSVAVMNVSSENYFTEVLTDCFALGTIPIFWGCPNIGEFFNANGILHFNTLHQLDEILNNISLDIWHSKKEQVWDNFSRCQSMISTDDNIAKILIEYFKHE